MDSYEIHRGIGKPLEFLGLKSIYIFMLPVAAGLSIMIYFLLTMNSVNVLVSLVISVVTAIILISVILLFNRKYGEKGINMLIAHHLVPEQIINNKRMFL